MANVSPLIRALRERAPGTTIVALYTVGFLLDRRLLVQADLEEPLPSLIALGTCLASFALATWLWLGPTDERSRIEDELAALESALRRRDDARFTTTQPSDPTTPPDPTTPTPSRRR